MILSCLLGNNVSSMRWNNYDGIRMWLRAVRLPCLPLSSNAEAPTLMKEAPRTPLPRDN